jgi:hypothetical protein
VWLRVRACEYDNRQNDEWVAGGTQEYVRQIKKSGGEEESQMQKVMTKARRKAQENKWCAYSVCAHMVLESTHSARARRKAWLGKV